MLAVVLFVLIAYEQWLWCLVVFAVAAVTDWLDGYLARKQGLMSTPWAATSIRWSTRC